KARGTLKERGRRCSPAASPGPFAARRAHVLVRKHLRGVAPYAPHLNEILHGLRLQVVELPLCLDGGRVDIGCHTARQRLDSGLEPSGTRLTPRSTRLTRSTAQGR